MKKIVSVLLFSISSCQAFSNSYQQEVKDLREESHKMMKSQFAKEDFLEFLTISKADKRQAQHLAKKAQENLSIREKDMESFLSELEGSKDGVSSNTPKQSCQSSLIKPEEGERSDKKEDLIIFVSLGMPKEALKKYYLDAEAVGGRLIIQGLVNNSFIETHKALVDLNINIDIDPTLFDRYEVSQVPVIMSTAGRQKDQIAGNMTLESALETFSKEGDTSKQANEMLKKLRGQQ
ncbi:MAG: type-F conjugative transfer system pilin assembly protein TrbC [Candidatus Paracaedibacteraceae bacterium]|nr:type-F conjugative transfer system pilin assembly protein TrbC [Candidatus Paracaedibacteraceae bacterium]